MQLVAAFGFIAVLIGLGMPLGHAAGGVGPAVRGPELMAPATRSRPLFRLAQAKDVQSAGAANLTQAEVERRFRPFADAFKKIQEAYIDKPDNAKLLRAAVEAMQAAFPAAEVTPDRPTRTSPISIATVYATGLEILNARPSRADDARLVGIAITGMVGALDSRSGYLDATTLRNTNEESRGQFGGVGLEVTMDKGLVKVVAPIDGSPAAKAGLMANDLITRIDDQAVEGLTLAQAVEKMRGPVNTRVKLTIVRAGQDNPVDVAITRDIIKLRSVRARLEADDIALIRLTRFDEQTGELLKRAIGDLSAQAGPRLRGFILDLRNNAGGLLDQAITVCDVFLEKGEIIPLDPKDDKVLQAAIEQLRNLESSQPNPSKSSSDSGR